ncbi:hypothetical protein, partial [Leptospira interrogans]|uniref:hypothetical protein n=1 Tax=Leptospira interrogans TaxID=173 RepID=UPI001F37AFE1
GVSTDFKIELLQPGLWEFPQISKSNCYNQVCGSSHTFKIKLANQICGSSYRFQNRTVTTRFVGVPTDFKIELLQPDLWEFLHFQN